MNDLVFLNIEISLRLTREGKNKRNAAVRRVFLFFFFQNESQLNQNKRKF